MKTLAIKLLATVIIMVVITGVLYILAAFVSMKWNPELWNPATRIILIMFAISIFIPVSIEVNEFIDKNTDL